MFSFVKKLMVICNNKYIRGNFKIIKDFCTNSKFDKDLFVA